MSKWTLITGGARNVGSEMAIHLAEEGHNILVHYNTSEASAQQVVKECRERGVKAEMIQGDFSTKKGVELFIHQLLTRFPDIQVLINNVGNYLYRSALYTDVGEWEEMFQSNLFVPIALIQALIPSIKAHEGSIINMGASGLFLKANFANTAYFAAKASLLILTKTLAKELAPFGVTVNMVSPGVIESSIQKVANVPMGRDAHFRDLTNVIIFLLKESSRYITGQNIEVAGGIGL